MTTAATTVALLFDDGELGAQLREVLQDHGAHIVYESGVAELDRALLSQLDADVLVINLDDAVEEALEGLYDIVPEGDRPRVLFNDAQASRGLSGWDRARWARHLAAKVLVNDEIDPPRPAGARSLETHAVAMDPEIEGSSMTTSAQAVSPAAGPGVDAVDTLTSEAAGSANSESLATELEALLASGELAEEADETFEGLRHPGREELPLHDGDFGEISQEQAVLPGSEPFTEGGSTAPTATTQGSRIFTLDHLQLTPLADTTGLEATGSLSTASTDAAEKDSPWQVPDSWTLLDDSPMAGTATAAVDKESDPGQADPSDFGIQKMSAADFLAPESSSRGADDDPVMSLELISVEEAIAPKPYEDEGAREIVLDMNGSALRRLILLGVAAGGEKSLFEFLAALPANLPLAFLLIQHADEQSQADRLERLAAHSTIPVRWAEDNGQTAVGEVRAVPAGYAAKLTRDGRIQLHPGPADERLSPSIDANFTLAANVFGRDALGIVMGGRSNDAIGGAQAIHDRGGQVWVEADDDYVTDMVRALFAERLVSFSGDASALAAHLVEVFS